MQRPMSVFLVTLCLLGGASADSVTPVQKVISLLNGMVEKGKSEKHAEEVAFADFKTFCDDNIVQEQRNVQQETEQIETLKARVSSEDVEAKRLGKRVSWDEGDMSAADGDINAATHVREREATDYHATHKDYSESIDALGRAIAVLKKQAFSRKQASFTQLNELNSLTLIPAEAKKKLALFFMQDQDDGDDEGLDISAPEANGYEFQSQRIIEMLEKLLDKFIEEKTALEKKEANAKHAYDMLVQDLRARIELDTKDKTESSSSKGQTLHARANDWSAELEELKLKAGDEDGLKALQAACSQKASEFEARQQLRTDELAALEQAIDIMSADNVSGHAQKYLPSMMQTKASALAQRRAAGGSPAQQRVVQYLQEQGERLGSRVLSALAIRAADDPFTKVKKMIKDLVVRLMEEANDEAEHKGWCDTELASNSQTREEKTAEAESLSARIDELDASIAKLTEQIGDLTKEVAEITAAVNEATKIREEEKAENTQTISDAKDAQTAVARAMTVLKQFYEQAGEAIAFLQASPYQGMQSENTGVIGMLEVIESDFARLEADTDAAESSAQKEYDDFATKSSEEKAVKNKSIEHKESNKQDQEQEHTLHKADLEGTTKELDAAMSYYDKLKPSCVDAGVSYDDRVARRKEEVESLQEALKILNGEDIA